MKKHDKHDKKGKLKKKESKKLKLRDALTTLAESDLTPVVKLIKSQELLVEYFTRKGKKKAVKALQAINAEYAESQLLPATISDDVGHSEDGSNNSSN